VRHPSFEAVTADHQARQGLPALQGDDVQYARVLALGNQRPVMPTWRWRVLHSPADAPRFMISDRGWMYVGMEDWPTHELLFPIGPRVAILGYLDDPGLPPRRPAFEEHLDLCPSTIDWINAAAWDDPYSNSSSPTPMTATGSQRCPTTGISALMRSVPTATASPSACSTEARPA